MSGGMDGNSRNLRSKSVHELEFICLFSRYGQFSEHIYTIHKINEKIMLNNTVRKLIKPK